MKYEAHTTSYKTSKQLLDLGFEDSYHTQCTEATDEDGSDTTIWAPIKIYFSGIPSYDLGTLLANMPKQIGDYKLRVFFEPTLYIAYQRFDGCHKIYNIKQEDEDTVADVAAKLLLLLHKNQIINL